jgi:hypothetical protein
METTRSRGGDDGGRKQAALGEQKLMQFVFVEPPAGDRFEDNLNPASRAYHGLSTLLCTPASLSQEVGLALGAQAGEGRIRAFAEVAGFTRFRCVAETPFSHVFEARP